MQNVDCRGKLCRVHLSYKGALNMELEVLEQGVGGPLSAGDELSPHGLQDDVVKLQGGQHRVVMVPGGGVAGPQVQACSACRRVLGFSGQVTAEEGFQRGQRGRGRVRSEVKGRVDVEIECHQVLEGVVGVEGVDLCGSDKVIQNDLVVSGIGGFLPVVLGHRLNPSQMSLYERQGQWDHRGNFGQMELPREPRDYCRGSGKRGVEGQPCFNSHKARGLRGQFGGNLVASWVLSWLEICSKL